MRVLINAVSARLGGGLTVLRNLLPALLAADGGACSYIVAGRPQLSNDLGVSEPRVSWMTTQSAEGRARLLWEQAVLPRSARGADVLFSPANLGLLVSPVPQVLMFQNMAPFDPDVVDRYRGTAIGRRLQMLRRLGQLTSRGARSVIFISDYVRRRIEPQLSLGSRRVARVYLGRDTSFAPTARRPRLELPSAGEVKGPYLLCVSQFYRYKNLHQLVQGFARAAVGLPESVSLLLAGAEVEPDYAAEVRRVAQREGVARRVVFLGQVPYEDLPPLYAGASMFLFPSTCESFPNILIEGMSSGVPTASSRIGPMPELAQDGAAYFDPFDPDDIAAVILRLWSDSAGSQALAKRGLEIASRYRWEDTARGLLAELERAVA